MLMLMLFGYLCVVLILIGVVKVYLDFDLELFFSDWFVDLVEECFDFVVCIGMLLNSSGLVV